MTDSQSGPGRRYGLYLLAVVLLLVGGAGIIFGSHNFQIRALGSIAILASVRVVQASRRPALPEGFRRIGESTPANDSRRSLWIASIALVPCFAASLFLLHIDAVNGAREAWPFYVFGAVGLVSFFVWIRLAIKIAGNLRGTQSEFAVRSRLASYWPRFSSLRNDKLG